MRSFNTGLGPALNEGNSSTGHSIPKAPSEAVEADDVADAAAAAAAAGLSTGGSGAQQELTGGPGGRVCHWSS